MAGDTYYSLRLSSGLFGSSVEIGVLVLAWILLTTSAVLSYSRAMTIMPSEKHIFQSKRFLLESNELLYTGALELNISDTAVFALEFLMNFCVIIAMNQGNGNLLSLCKSSLTVLLVVRVVLFLAYVVTSFIDQFINLGLFYIGMILIYLVYYLYYFLMIASCFRQYMPYVYPSSPAEGMGVYQQPTNILPSILRDPTKPCPNTTKNRKVLSVVSSFCKIPNPKKPVHFDDNSTKALP